MSGTIYVNCDALEDAARRLGEDEGRIRAAAAQARARSSGVLGTLRARGLEARALRAAAELERERLFLLESAKRFRGAQTRAVRRNSDI